MTRKEQLVLLALAGAISAGSLVLYFHHTRQDPPEATAAPHDIAPKLPPSVPLTATAPKDLSSRPNTTPAPPSQITVSVVGAVRRPGVYKLDTDARVKDAIDMAGGTSEGANVTGLNLAAKLMDGSTLSVPINPVWDPKIHKYVYPSAEAVTSNSNPPQYTRSGWMAGSTTTPAPAPAISPTPTADTAGMGGLINLNTATQQQLESLPGIGPKLAQQIIQYRSRAPFQTVEDLDNVPGFGVKRVEQMRPLVTVR